MGWLLDRQIAKYEEALIAVEDERIRDRNVHYALELGIIDWFQYLEYHRNKGDLGEKEIKAQLQGSDYKRAA